VGGASNCSREARAIQQRCVAGERALDVVRPKPMIRNYKDMKAALKGDATLEVGGNHGSRDYSLRRTVSAADVAKDTPLLL